MNRQSGAALMYVIVALVTFAVLGTAIVSFFSSSQLGTARPNCPKKATYMAESGVRYAIDQLVGITNPTSASVNSMVTVLEGGTAYSKTYTVTDGGTFALDIDCSGLPDCTINSRGTSCTGDEAATSQSSATITIPMNDEPLAFEEGDTVDFSPVGQRDQNGDGDPDQNITVNNTDQTVTLGNHVNNSYGCLWYTGNKETCVNGNCTFENGIRAYFKFVVEGWSHGDGFTFSVISANTNNATACGGNTRHGEVLGYAGPGISGNGIKPPKMGVEMDIHRNGCNNNVCGSGSRCDDSNRDHMAVLYWGSNSRYSSTCDETLDDNRHGAGDDTPTSPKNPDDWNDSGNGTDGYYYRSNRSNSWLQNGINHNSTSLCRVEIIRSDTANADGNFCYTFKTWLRQEGDIIEPEMKDVTANYSAAPDMIDAVVIAPDLHTAFNNVMFGWTVATGSATETVTVSDFTLDVVEDAEVCASALPADYVAYWPMYEGTGIVLHDLGPDSVNGVILNNSNSLPTDAEWVSGVRCPHCAALKFNPRYGRVHMDHDDALNLTATGSISCWINMTDFNNNFAGIVHKGERSDWSGPNQVASDECYSLQYYRGKLTLGVIQDRNNVATVETNYTWDNSMVNTWYHIVATWDAANLNLYINGALDNTAANGGGVAARTSTGGLQIGSQLNHTFSRNFTFDGLVDDVALYNRALTPAEIQAIYRAGIYN